MSLLGIWLLVLHGTKRIIDHVFGHVSVVSGLASLLVPLMAHTLLRIVIVVRAASKSVHTVARTILERLLILIGVSISIVASVRFLLRDAVRLVVRLGLSQRNTSLSISKLVRIQRDGTFSLRAQRLSVRVASFSARSRRRTRHGESRTGCLLWVAGLNTWATRIASSRNAVWHLIHSLSWTKGTDFRRNSFHSRSLLLWDNVVRWRTAAHAARINVKVEELHVDELLLLCAQRVVVSLDEALQSSNLLHNQRVTISFVRINITKNGLK